MSRIASTPWTTKELNLCVTLYNEGHPMTYIRAVHDRTFGERSYTAIIQAIYQHPHVMRHFRFKAEELDWIKSHSQMDYKEAWGLFEETFRPVKEGSFRARMREFREEAKA